MSWARRAASDSEPDLFGGAADPLKFAALGGWMLAEGGAE